MQLYTQAMQISNGVRTGGSAAELTKRNINKLGFARIACSGFPIRHIHSKIKILTQPSDLLWKLI